MENTIEESNPENYTNENSNLNMDIMQDDDNALYGDASNANNEPVGDDADNNQVIISLNTLSKILIYYSIKMNFLALNSIFL